MYLSVKIEEMYSKNDILLMYLNTVNYGSGAYGIQAASSDISLKHATDLTLRGSGSAYRHPPIAYL